MKNKKTTRAVLVILIAIIWITANFVFQNRELLFDNNSINGESRITLKLLSDIDNEDIRTMLGQTSIQSIDIQESNSGGKEAIIRMEYLDTSKSEALTARLQEEYGEDIALLSAENIGGRITWEARYIIFAAVGIVVAIIIVLLIVYIRTIKKGMD